MFWAILPAACAPPARDGVRQEAPPAEPVPKIAFVDFERVVENCRGLDGLRAELKAVEEELTRRELGLPKFADDKPGESDADLRRRKETLGKELTRKRVETFGRVREIVDALARERRLDSVFKWDAPKLDSGDPEIDDYELRICRILYRAQALDLTDDVSRLLEGHK